LAVTFGSGNLRDDHSENLLNLPMMPRAFDKTCPSRRYVTGFAAEATVASQISKLRLAHDPRC
jgi:hypothetical protein